MTLHLDPKGSESKSLVKMQALKWFLCCPSQRESHVSRKPWQNTLAITEAQIWLRSKLSNMGDIYMEDKDAGKLLASESCQSFQVTSGGFKWTVNNASCHSSTTRPDPQSGSPIPPCGCGSWQSRLASRCRRGVAPSALRKCGGKEMGDQN